MIEQAKEHIEGFTPQPYLLIASPKLRVYGVEAKRREDAIWFRAHDMAVSNGQRLNQLHKS
jgi:hypothetical protein